MRLALAISASLVLLFSPAMAQARTVNVSTVAELNSAVGERNATVVVAPGTYELTQALVLAEGVKLRGPNVFRLDRNGVPVPISGDTFVDPAHEAVLDGSDLPALDVGVINPGANNEIRGLTIVGNEFASAGVDAVFTSADGGHVVITNCLLEGSARGMRLLSQFTSGATSSAVLESNVIRFTGQGVLLLHAETNNDTLNANLRSNRIYGTDTGLESWNLASNNSKISITSRQSIYTSNRIGVNLFGGFDFIVGPSQNNLVTLDSKSDTITNNSGPGGRAVQVIGALLLDSSRSGSMSGNNVRLKFLHTTFTNGEEPENGEPGAHIDALFIGVFSAPGDPVGTDNTVSALVRGATGNGDPATFLYANGFPDDPPGSNRVTTTGSDTAFVKANEGIQVPVNAGP